MTYGQKMKMENLIKEVEQVDFLSNDEKRKIKFYLTDEDYINESHAIVFLVELVLRKGD